MLETQVGGRKDGHRNTTVGKEASSRFGYPLMAAFDRLVGATRQLGGVVQEQGSQGWQPRRRERWGTKEQEKGKLDVAISIILQTTKGWPVKGEPARQEECGGATRRRADRITCAGEQRAYSSKQLRVSCLGARHHGSFVKLCLLVVV